MHILTQSAMRVMCPDLKLQWLRDNGFPESDIQRIYQLVIDRFHVYNAPNQNSSSAVQERQIGQDSADNEVITQ